MILPFPEPRARIFGTTEFRTPDPIPRPPKPAAKVPTVVCSKCLHGVSEAGYNGGDGSCSAGLSNYQHRMNSPQAERRLPLTMERIPYVSREDVLRIIARDFPRENWQFVPSLLDQYGTEPSHFEKDRVQLAILKLSRGDLERLQHYVGVAQDDPRDVLYPAEFPLSLQSLLGGAGTMSAEVAVLQEADMRQYDAWLRSTERCGGAEESAAVLNAEQFYFRGPAMRRHGIPSWTGPLVGPFVGVAFVLPALGRVDNHRHILLLLCIGAILGFAAGIVVWIIDACLRPR